MVEALVEHDYIAREQDELTIRKGDIIKDVTIKSGGWMEGVLNEKKGMFPDNFVKILDMSASSVVLRDRKESTRIRQCRVVFSYKQEHEDELNLSVGDVIEVLGEEEEGWWRGVLNGNEGVFPSNFVEEITPVISKPRPSSRDDGLISSGKVLRTPSLPAKPIKILCEAKYPYKAQNIDELTLKEGDIITLISKDGEDIGWWKGELNGQVGVFPDNFVVLLPATDETKVKEDRKPVDSPTDSTSNIKPSSLISQRRSLENKGDKSESDSSTKVTPPILGKKPSVALKKSPTGPFVSNIKKKMAEIADAVDGVASSKPSGSPKGEVNVNDLQNNENAFDQVERRPLLSDVRATRAKAPGRRPPSVVYKEGDLTVPNGNADHVNLDSLNEPHSNARPPSTEPDTEVKPKLREWEKHKAPWLEEMKLNQAKRTSTSPGPEHRQKLTPTDKTISDGEEIKSTKTSPFEKEGSPVDMSKSMPSLGNKLKTPPSNEAEKVQVRSKPRLPLPVRPQTVSGTSIVSSDVAPVSKPAVASTVITNRPPSPMTKPHHQPQTQPHSQTHIQSNPASQISEKSPSTTVTTVVDFKAGGDSVPESVSHKQYAELLERIQKLEAIVEKQHEVLTNKIEELRGKLQVETDMRMLLQAELERVSKCVTQVWLGKKFK